MNNLSVHPQGFKERPLAPERQNAIVHLCADLEDFAQCGCSAVSLRSLEKSVSPLRDKENIY